MYLKYKLAASNSALLEEEIHLATPVSVWQRLKNSFLAVAAEDKEAEKFTMEQISHFMKESSKSRACLNFAAVFLIVLVAFLTGFYH